MRIVVCLYCLFQLIAVAGFGQVMDSLPAPVPPKHMTFLNDTLKPFYIVEDDSTYTYSMIVEDLDRLLLEYPAFVHPVEVGKSEFGLELKTVRIGRVKRNANSMLLVGNIHGREDFSSKLLMKFLNVYLLSIAGKSDLYPDAATLLDSIDIYVMPVANPDGLKIAQEDFAGIRDLFNLYKDSILCIETYKEWKANGKGIDLNRTFDDGNFEVKKGSSYQAVPASEGYKGKFPAEPVETQHIQRLVASIRPLVTASFHTKGNILFWADAKTHPFLGNIDTYITTEIADATGFKTASIAKYASEYGCGLENYVRAEYGLIGTCVELSRGDKTRQQFPDDQFNAEVWLLAWDVPAIFIRNAVRYRERILENSAVYLSRSSN